MRSVVAAAVCLQVFLSPLHIAYGDDRARISHLYNLSDFNGVVPFNNVAIHVDWHTDEVFCLVGNSVQVFNSSGMEIFRFHLNVAALGTVVDLTVEPSGDILILTWGRNPDSQTYGLWRVLRLDFRGRLIEEIQFTEMPEESTSFGPNRLYLHQDRILLVSLSQLLVLAFTPSGGYLQQWDLVDLANIENPNSAEIQGFSFDRAGNMYFTIPTLFKAYILRTDGTLEQFGAPGSAPGKFGIVAGIIADDHGNILIADKLRNVVMVFGRDRQFLTEFYRQGKGYLVRPTRLAMGPEGRFYVSQVLNQGVAVFRISFYGKTSSDSFLTQ